MLTVDEARHRIMSFINPLGCEDVQISEAIGRCLTAAVLAQRTLPLWDNSAVDGYAVRSTDLASGLTQLRVVEEIFAGDVPTREIGSGSCARIMTGAALPAGADAVIMQEKTRILPEGKVELAEVVTAGVNIRRRGEDRVQGQLLMPAGSELNIANAGALWADGRQYVSVARRPRVAIVTSGDELCDVGAFHHAKVVDTNSPVIAAAVQRAGGIAQRLGRARDTLESIRSLCEQGLDADVLLTVAGVSVGQRDFTREALRSLGVELDFWTVAMKPGKPLVFGRRGQTLVFGLPGNPVSALVTFELFVRPALRALQGLPPFAVPLPARAAVAIRKPVGLRHFVRATFEVKGETIWATPVGSQSSGALSSAAAATCLIDVPQDQEIVEIGSHCQLLPVSWAGERNLC